MIRQAVIIAAGNGSRFKDQYAPEHFAKPLLPLNGKALIDWVIDALRSNGVERFVVVTGYNSHLLKAHFDGRPELDVTLVFNPEWKRPNGISALVSQTALRSDEPFLLLMADHVFHPGLLSAAVEADLPADHSMLLVDPAVGDIFDIDDATKVLTSGDRIADIGKTIAAYNAIDTGIFVHSPSFFAVMADAIAEGKCSLTDGIRRLADLGRMLVAPVEHYYWQDVDTPEALAIAHERLHLLDPSFTGDVPTALSAAALGAAAL